MFSLTWLLFFLSFSFKHSFLFPFSTVNFLSFSLFLSISVSISIYLIHSLTISLSIFSFLFFFPFKLHYFPRRCQGNVDLSLCQIMEFTERAAAFVHWCRLIICRSQVASAGNLLLSKAASGSAIDPQRTKQEKSQWLLADDNLFPRRSAITRHYTTWQSPEKEMKKGKYMNSKSKNKK